MGTRHALRRAAAAFFGMSLAACGPSAAHVAAARHEIANYHDGCNDEQVVVVEAMGSDSSSTIVSRGCGASSERFRCTQRVAPFGKPGPVRCERMQRSGSDWVVDITPIPQPMTPPPGWVPKERTAESPASPIPATVSSGK